MPSRVALAARPRQRRMAQSTSTQQPDWSLTVSSFYIDPAEEPGYAAECDGRAQVCPTCGGCGQIGSDDEGTPWTFWAELKPPSNIAARKSTRLNSSHKCA